MYIIRKTSIQILPELLEKVFQILTESFDAQDCICVALWCHDLRPAIHLTMRKLWDVNVVALVQIIDLLNSQNKFKIDNSSGVHISRTTIPSRGAKRKHVHTDVDRKRFAPLIVSIAVDKTLFTCGSNFEKVPAYSRRLEERKGLYVMEQLDKKRPNKKVGAVGPESCEEMPPYIWTPVESTMQAPC